MREWCRLLGIHFRLTLTGRSSEEKKCLCLLFTQGMGQVVTGLSLLDSIASLLMVENGQKPPVALVTSTGDPIKPPHNWQGSLTQPINTLHYSPHFLSETSVPSQLCQAQSIFDGGPSNRLKGRRLTLMYLVVFHIQVSAATSPHPSTDSRRRAHGLESIYSAPHWNSFLYITARLIIRPRRYLGWHK
jgi:hypothetical protein